MSYPESAYTPITQYITKNHTPDFAPTPTHMFVPVPHKDSEHVTVIRHDQFVEKLFKKESDAEEFKHAALGVCSEAGELADAIKKHAVYGKPIDRTNVIEEIGDLLFFVRKIQNKLGISDTEVLAYNGAKLSARYEGLTYSNEAAIARADKNEPTNSAQD